MTHACMVRPQVMHSYVDAVGHVPMLPGYAAGYWHSRNRYASQVPPP